MLLTPSVTLSTHVWDVVAIVGPLPCQYMW
jgi:hypothetical protein